MKITCGTDIIEIERVKESIENVGTKFIERVYTEKEIEYCESRKKQKYQHYAGRFAAKEAIIKAISQYENPHMLEINIYNDTNGKPIVKYKNYKIMLSISHEDNYAIAFAIIEKR